jgi:hypothetical protein
MTRVWGESIGSARSPEPLTRPVNVLPKPNALSEPDTRTSHSSDVNLQAATEGECRKPKIDHGYQAGRDKMNITIRGTRPARSLVTQS